MNRYAERCDCGSLPVVKSEYISMYLDCALLHIDFQWEKNGMLSSCRRNKVKYLKVYQSFNFLEQTFIQQMCTCT